MSLFTEMNAEFKYEARKEWEKHRGLLVGESFGVWSAGQIYPPDLIEQQEENRKIQNRGKR